MESILCSYNMWTRKMRLPKSATDFESSVRKEFEIPLGSSIVIQKHDKEWNEYIDITDDCLSSGGRYRVLNSDMVNFDNIPMVIDSSFTSNVAGSSFAEGSILNERDTECLDLLEVEKKPKLKNWNGEFHLPEDRFSTSLKVALSEQVDLGWKLKSIFLDEICQEIMSYTMYPSSNMYYDIAKQIVLKYPYLKESIGSGFGGWKQCIINKMKNIRRSNDSDVVLKKKKRLLGKENEPSSSTINDCVLIENNEQVISFRESISVLLKEKGHKLKDVKEKFPYLFTKLNIEREWNTLNSKAHLYQSVSRYLTANKGPLVEYVKSKKKLKKWAEEVLKTCEDQDNCEEILALLTLPALFDEEAIIKVYKLGTSLDEVKQKLSAPHAVIFGNAFGQDLQVHILTDNEVIMTVESVKDSLAIVVALYYLCNVEYAKESKNSLIYLQVKMFDIDYTSKLPPKVISVVQKLSNIVCN